MFKKILAALMCAAAMVVSGCGGGGGGGGSQAGSDAIGISFSTQAVAAQATTYVTPANSGFTMTLANIPSGGVYVVGSYTKHALASVALNISGNTAYFTLTFRAPETLGVGVYTDTIDIALCMDQQCAQPASAPRTMAVTYTVTASGTVGTAPTVSLVSPSTVNVGGSDFTLTLNGSGFDSSSKVYWGGIVKKTTYVSPTQLIALVPASDIATAGSYSVLVTRSSNLSAPSTISPITVSNLPLSIAKLSPVSATAGNSTFTETIVGTGFDNTSTVLWNGSARPTTFVSTTQLLAQINAADVASLTTASVTVSKAGVSPSNAKAVSVVAPSTDATSNGINPQNTSAINFANIVAPSAFPLTSKWTASLNGPAARAMVAGGRVIVTTSLLAGGSELSALSAASGATLWGPIAIPNRAVASYDNGRVFVLSTTPGSGAAMYAYDAATGSALWNTALTSQSSFYGSPTAAHGMVFVAGEGFGATLYALDQTTGALVWTQDFSGGNASPTVTADGVYMTSDCDSYGFRPLTGDVIWHVNHGCGGGGVNNFVARNDLLFTSKFNGTSYIGVTYDPKTGALVSNLSGGAPSVVGSQMGYRKQSGGLVAIRLSDGAVPWYFNTIGDVEGLPVLVNNYVFTLDNGGILDALDATTGSLLWQTNMGNPLASGFYQSAGVSAGGGLLFVYVGTTLVAYTLSSNP